MLRSFSATLRHSNKAGHNVTTVFSGRMKSEPHERLLAMVYEIGKLAEIYGYGEQAAIGIDRARKDVQRRINAIHARDKLR